MLSIALWIVGIVAAYVAIDRIGVWAEGKGWIYWRKRRGGGLAAAFTDAFDQLRPETNHVMQAKDAKKLEERDSGDPPELRG